jgi:hypothetical protein
MQVRKIVEEEHLPGITNIIHDGRKIKRIIRRIFWYPESDIVSHYPFVNHNGRPFKPSV